MTEQLRFLVGALNRSPFNKSFNLISLDSLEPLQLLQVVSDVLAVIEEQATFDIRQETAEETAMRLFEALRILRFKAPSDPDELNAFRLGLVVGDKHIIYPVLTWMLQRIPELQKRAYLAKYLVSVYVPPEFYSDPEVEQTIHKCDQLMEDFKEVHKEYSMLKADGLNSEEIRVDIQSMEQERDQITKRVDKLKKRVEGMANKDTMLEVAKLLRSEVERETQLGQQKQEQRNAHVNAEQKLQRIQQQMKELKQQMNSTRPEDLIQKLEEENKIHTYMIEEKLAHEIASKRKAVQELQKVASTPAIDHNDIKQIQNKLAELNQEITELIEKKNLTSNPTDDKLAIFRQQANIVQRKKASAAEVLQDVRQEAQSLENDLKTKKGQMRDSEGNEVVTNIQFKNYVNKLRGKTNNYKKKRSDLQDWKAEIGVVQRTDEILKGQLENMKKTMEIEDDADEGIAEDGDDEHVVVGGGRPQTSKRPQTAKLVGKSADELKGMVQSLEERVEVKKKQLAPLLQELRPLREQLESMESNHSKEKQKYDAKALSLESGYSQLEQEVKSYRTEFFTNESKFFKLDAEKRILVALVDRAKSDPGFKEKLLAKINEAEEFGKKLKDQQKSGSEDQQDSARQMKLWRDLMKLMEYKKVCFQNQYGQSRVASGVESTSVIVQPDPSSGPKTLTRAQSVVSQASTARPQSRRGSSFNLE